MTLAHVYGALAYYHRHCDEVRDYQQRRQAQAEASRREIEARQGPGDASPSAQLAAILRAMGMEEDAPRWMHTPLPTFAGKTPVELLGAGRGQELVDRLLANAIGNVGS